MRQRPVEGVVHRGDGGLRHEEVRAATLRLLRLLEQLRSVHLIHPIVPPGVVLATAPEHFFFYLLGPDLGPPFP